MATKRNLYHPQLQMAEAGFYWKGTNNEPDTAACFLCGKVLDGWEEADDPWMEHKKHAPQCTFAKNGKAEDEYTVGELIDLMHTYNKTQQEQNKRNFLKLKGKVEELKDGMRDNLKAH